MAEPIRVIIKDETGSKEQVLENNLSGNQTSLNTEQAIQNKRTSALVSVGVFVAARSVSYASSNIGKWTGSRQAQTRINNITKGVGYAATLSANFWMGAAVIATDAAFNFADYLWERRAEEKRSYQAKARNGDLGGYRR